MTHCSLCWETGPVVPSLRDPDAMVCRSCQDYEEQWAAMSPAERRADHEAANAYCEQTREF